MLHCSRVSVAAVFIVAVAACDDSTTEPPAGDPTHWSAELVAEGDATLAGTASVASLASELAATIEIVEGPASAVHAWYIGEGECGGEEGRVGDAEDYPLLELDEEGEAVVEAEVAAGLDPDGEYHVAVLASDDDDTVVACGALVVDDE